MNVLIVCGVIIVSGVLVVFIGWKCFFKWYKRKRSVDTQIFMDSLTKKKFEDIHKII